MEASYEPSEPERDEQILAACDRNADASFQLLDAMEADDAREGGTISQISVRQRRVRGASNQGRDASPRQSQDQAG